jgi:hypothetical protein
MIYHNDIHNIIICAIEYRGKSVSKKCSLLTRNEAIG